MKRQSVFDSEEVQVYESSKNPGAYVVVLGRNLDNQFYLPFGALEELATTDTETLVDALAYVTDNRILNMVSTSGTSYEAIGWALAQVQLKAKHDQRPCEEAEGYFINESGVVEHPSGEPFHV